MLDLLKISKEIKEQKISVVCSTCDKYWDARNRNIPAPKCMSTSNCASPIGGGTFHEYEGPMPSFEMFCIICGEFPHAHLLVGKSLKKFAICKEHLDFARTLSPMHIDDHEDLNRFVLKDGVIKKLNETDIYQKKTLIQKMEDADEYLANKNKKFNV